MNLSSSCYVATVYVCSGEIVAESCHLGTAHPPGYPLLTMLNYAFMKAVSQGSPAWRANLLSAIADTACAACIVLSVNLLGSLRCKPGQGAARLAAACSVAMLYAFSPLTWQYAVTAEVFALNNALTAFLVYLTLAFAASSTSQGRLFYAHLGALVCGLALCNQHTAVLFEVPLILFVLWGLRRELAVAPGHTLATLSFCFLVGLAPYAYLPIAAIMSPKPGAWGDVTTMQGFLHHLR